MKRMFCLLALIVMSTACEAPMAPRPSRQECTGGCFRTFPSTGDFGVGFGVGPSEPSRQCVVPCR